MPRSLADDADDRRRAQEQKASHDRMMSPAGPGYSGPFSMPLAIIVLVAGLVGVGLISGALSMETVEQALGEAERGVREWSGR